MYKFLVIPIEIQKRELLPACNILIEAINKGCSVIIGQKQEIFPFIEKLPSSTWYLKSIVPGEISLLRKIKKYNHKITTLDIEGLITPNLRDSLKTRFSKKTIDLADAIFFWGNKQFSLFKRNFKLSNNNKLHITGSPVAEEWLKARTKFKKKNKNIKKKILIIPSFGYANTATKNLNLIYAFDNLGVKNYYEKLEPNNKLYKGIYKNIIDDFNSQKLAYLSFKKMIPKLCETFKNHSIVIRPHPAENKNLWNSLRKIKNIKIDNSTDSNEQIASSQFIIHFNSTMSVQSAIMGKTNIIYCDLNKRYKKIINPSVFELSHFCKNFNELKKIIKQNKKKNYASTLKNLLAKTNYDKKNSSYEILKVMENLQFISNYKKFDINSLNFKIISFYLYVRYEILNSVIVPILSYFSFIPSLKKFSHGKIYRKHNISRRELIENKWKKININDIQKVLNKAKQFKKIKNKFKIHQHFSGFFYFENLNKK